MLKRNLIRCRENDTEKILHPHHVVRKKMDSTIALKDISDLEIFQTWESNHISYFTLNHQNHRETSRIVKCEHIAKLKVDSEKLKSWLLKYFMLDQFKNMILDSDIFYTRSSYIPRSAKKTRGITKSTLFVATYIRARLPCHWGGARGSPTNAGKQ